MTAPPSLLEVPTVITTHQNADFDALAAVVGASLLYPEGRIVFAGSLNPNVREFVSLHGENLPIVNLRLLDQSKIRQLIVVDTADTGADRGSGPPVRQAWGGGGRLRPP